MLSRAGGEGMGIPRKDWVVWVVLCANWQFLGKNRGA